MIYGVAGYTGRIPRTFETFVRIRADAFPEGDLAVMPDGPTFEQREASRYHAAVEVIAKGGRLVRSLLDTVTGYTFTTLAAQAAHRMLKGEARPGFQTPAGLFGDGFAETIADTSITGLEAAQRNIPMDEKHRCSWAVSDPLMQHYHDTEWGVPEHGPRMLWETLMLEGFQAGLSWAIILRKREAFRNAFANFDPGTVAAFDGDDVERLMADAGIVRGRAKILATIRGAQIFNEMQARGEDFADYCWSFTAGIPIAGSGHTTQTELSARISKELKTRGFKFVGPTIVYAWMQAVGLINDHEPACFRRREIMRLEAARGAARISAKGLTRNERIGG